MKTPPFLVRALIGRKTPPFSLPWPGARQSAAAGIPQCGCRLAAFLCLLLPSAMRAETVPAARAYDFHHSIGINIHLHYDSTPYGANWPEIRDYLADLGVMHTRDRLVFFSHNFGALERHKYLYDTFGIKTCLVVDRRLNDVVYKKEPLQDHLVGPTLDVAEQQGVLPAIEAVQGPNEYDMNGPDGPWVDKLRSFQQTLFDEVTSRPAWNGRAVVAPSVSRAIRIADLGDMGGMVHRGAGHPYPGGNFHPGSGAAVAEINRFFAHAPGAFPGKKLWITETGYHTYPHDTNHYPVTEDLKARYIPRLSAELFRRGAARTYIYELCDTYQGPTKEANFGLIDSSGSSGNFTLTPKPAYYALRSLIGLIRDHHADAATFAPGQLDMTFSGTNENTRTILLQKAGGDFYLMFWREVHSPSPSNTPFTITFNSPVADATLYAYNSGYNYAGTPLTIADNSVAVQAYDKIRVLKISLPTASFGPGSQVSGGIGATIATVNSTGYRVDTRFTALASGSLNSFTFASGGSTGYAGNDPAAFAVDIYSDNNGNPGALLGTSSSIAFNNAGGRCRSAGFTGIHLTAGVNYHAVIRSETASPEKTFAVTFAQPGFSAPKVDSWDMTTPNAGYQSRVSTNGGSSWTTIGSNGITAHAIDIGGSVQGYAYTGSPSSPASALGQIFKNGAAEQFLTQKFTFLPPGDRPSGALRTVSLSLRAHTTGMRTILFRLARAGDLSPVAERAVDFDFTNTSNWMPVTADFSDVTLQNGDDYVLFVGQANANGSSASSGFLTARPVEYALGAPTLNALTFQGADSHAGTSSSLNSSGTALQGLPGRADYLFRITYADIPEPPALATVNFGPGSQVLGGISGTTATVNSHNYWVGTRFTALNSGSLDTFSFASGGSTGYINNEPGAFVVDIYADDGGNPGALLGSSSSSTFNNTGARTRSADFLGITLTAGANYHAVIRSLTAFGMKTFAVNIAQPGVSAPKVDSRDMTTPNAGYQTRISTDAGSSWTAVGSGGITAHTVNIGGAVQGYAYTGSPSTPASALGQIFRNAAGAQFLSQGFVFKPGDMGPMGTLRAISVGLRANTTGLRDIIFRLARAADFSVVAERTVSVDFTSTANWVAVTAVFPATPLVEGVEYVLFVGQANDNGSSASAGYLTGRPVEYGLGAPTLYGNTFQGAGSYAGVSDSFSSLGTALYGQPGRADYLFRLTFSPSPH